MQVYDTKLVTEANQLHKFIFGRTPLINMFGNKTVDTNMSSTSLAHYVWNVVQWHLINAYYLQIEHLECFVST